MLFEVGIPNSVCLASWLAECPVRFSGHCDLDL